mmetsp:Transcript_40721/g.80247  ORF Transcript_40721/g.80247 Transcript_40721/m.80247 type:complete len:220 (-) Transcript_40721:635-1294(-)
MQQKKHADSPLHSNRREGVEEREREQEQQQEDEWGNDETVEGGDTQKRSTNIKRKNQSFCPSRPAYRKKKQKIVSLCPCCMMGVCPPWRGADPLTRLTVRVSCFVSLSTGQFACSTTQKRTNLLAVHDGHSSVSSFSHITGQTKSAVNNQTQGSHQNRWSGGPFSFPLGATRRKERKAKGKAKKAKRSAWGETFLRSMLSECFLSDFTETCVCGVFVCH